jgi:DNA-binding CsgD family transcriptional regulator
MSHTTPPIAHRRLAFLLFAVCAWGIADISLDSPSELTTVHVVLEVTLLVCSLWGGIWLWRSWRKSELELHQARTSLEESRHSTEQWRKRAAQFIDGFSLAIAEQFEAWKLTPAEAEVAQYLLGGFSHKNIAKFTDRSERTVRQHSVAVYKKAKLAGRAELSAFFLEGLLPPRPEV